MRVDAGELQAEDVLLPLSYRSSAGDDDLQGAVSPGGPGEVSSVERLDVRGHQAKYHAPGEPKPCLPLRWWMLSAPYQALLTPGRTACGSSDSRPPLNCSNFPLHLPDGSTLSRLLCTFPNVSRIVDDDERVFNLQRRGGRYTGIECLGKATVEDDLVTGSIDHLVAPRWVPIDWEITWNLSVTVRVEGSDRKLVKKLENACRNRQGVWSHRIQTLTIDGLPRIAFAALFGALLEGQNSAPPALIIFIDGYSYQDIQALGSITSGHVRTVGIIAQLNPDSSMVPDLPEVLDRSTFRGVENFVWVIGEHSFAPPLGFDLAATADQHPGISISAASALSQLHLQSFTLQVDSGHDSSPVIARGQGTGPIFTPSKLARSMLAIGGPACLYTIAPGPHQSGDERIQHFYEDLTTFVRAEMAPLIEDQLRRRGQGGWMSG